MKQHLQNIYLNRKGFTLIEVMVYMICLSIILVMFGNIISKVGIDERYKKDVATLQNFRALVQDVAYSTNFDINSTGLAVRLEPSGIVYKFENRALTYTKGTSTYTLTDVSYGEFTKIADGLLEVKIVTKDTTHILTLSTDVVEEEGVILVE